MSESLSPNASDVERALEIVKSHAHGSELAALVYDLVSRQAEGRVLFTGERFVAARAEEHKVDAKMAETPLANVLSVLESGPTRRSDWALLSALHVRGFSEAFAQKPDEEKSELVARFVQHADWLESATSHRPLTFARELLPEELASQTWARVGAAVLEDDASPTPARRGRNALRLAALAAVVQGRHPGAARAREALETVQRAATDVWSRTLARVALTGEEIAAEPRPITPSAAAIPAADEPLVPIRIAGVVARAPTIKWWAPLRWLSGFAVVRWIVAGFATLLGVRRHVFVELQGEALSVRIATRWLGRTVRSSDVVHGLSHVAAVRRVSRYASLHLLVGVTLFAAGLLLGGWLLGDGFRSHDKTLLLLGAGLLLGGAALDLVLSVIVPAAARRVRIELDFGEHGRLDVAGVPAADADRLMHSLLEHVATRA